MKKVMACLDNKIFSGVKQFEGSQICILFSGRKIIKEKDFVVNTICVATFLKVENDGGGSRKLGDTKQRQKYLNGAERGFKRNLRNLFKNINLNIGGQAGKIFCRLRGGILFVTSSNDWGRGDQK